MGAIGVGVGAEVQTGAGGVQRGVPRQGARAKDGVLVGRVGRLHRPVRAISLAAVLVRDRPTDRGVEVYLPTGLMGLAGDRLCPRGSALGVAVFLQTGWIRPDVRSNMYIEFIDSRSLRSSSWSIHLLKRHIVPQAPICWDASRGDRWQ